MAEESDLERTEEPSARRLEKARSEGQVPQSRELGTFMILLVGASLLWGMGGWLMRRTISLVETGLTLEPSAMHEPQRMFSRFTDFSFEALLLLSPFFLALMLAALIGPLALKGFIFSPASLQPKFSRLNPLQGIKRVISKNGLVELIKAVLKATLIVGISSLVIWKEFGDLMGLLSQPLHAGLGNAGRMITQSFLLVVCGMILIVAADVPFQLWQYYDKLKMTKEEVRQEHKEMEGDPHIKARIRSIQRDTARRRMMSAVPQADVIVTNPTHFAVALSYSEGMKAPKVVAKGMGEIARRIKAIAAEHGVPLLEAPPLARALYRHVELDREIPGALYAAVAEALAWVYQLSAWRKTGGQYPQPPNKLEVPEEFFVGEVNG
ncbi:MAG: flagellar biosynthesis protein FlhB [Betaproteobacteria bacterium]|nr:flagellar biosynthesis protein FlhB [Betaproteobacteria bacterium]